MFTSLKPLGNTSSLPNGYRRVEYLESTGTQYIDTLWRPEKDYELEIDCNFLNTNNQCLYGRKSYDPFRSDFVMFFNNGMLAGYNATAEIFRPGTLF